MEYIDNTILAIIGCLFFAFVSVLTGGFYVDKYIQLMSLTKRSSVFLKVTVKIIIFLFFIPALLIFIAVKLLQNYILQRFGHVTEPGLAGEVLVNSANVSIFFSAFVILLVVLGLLLVRMSQTRKMIAYVPAIATFTFILIIITKKLVLPLFLVCTLLSIMLLYFYRKSKIGEEL